MNIQKTDDEHSTPNSRSANRIACRGSAIFTVMSALAAKHGAVNLGPGYPDVDCDPKLVNAIMCAMEAGQNQYSPMPGVASLRSAIAARLRKT
jgi:methionine aminotransferase